MAIIGKPIDRVDAFLKVTGGAKYAAEFNQINMAYAFPVRSTIGKGIITGFDMALAEKSAGVIGIMTHKNAPRLQPFDPKEMGKAGGYMLEDLVPLQDNKVHYFGQFVAIVLAESYEQARCASTLIKVTYVKETPESNLKAGLKKGFKPETLFGEEAQINTGKAAAVIEASPVKMEHIYTTPTEVHNPMEPHAAIAMWEGSDKLTIYDSTQLVMPMRGITAYFFGLKPENVRILCLYLGGGFGGKSPGAYNLLAAMAAKKINRPVKLVITRQMMQTNVGRRPETIQKVALAADLTGKLTALRHQNNSYTNLSEFYEPSGLLSKILYDAPVREVTYNIVKLNINTPTWMRAPGEASGSFALESAIDEMAFKLKIDPLQFRILNHAVIDPLKKIEFSSNHLLECYQTGAEKFGWSNRKLLPRQTRNGRYLVGYGMAVSSYPGYRSSAAVKVQMTKDGAVKVMTATQDLGTGTYTIIMQTAADGLGIAAEKITVLIGDSNLPPAPLSGGSMTTASVMPAVFTASEMLRKDLLQLAIADPQSKLNGTKPEDITFANARFYTKDNISISDSYADIMQRNGKEMMEVCTSATPGTDMMGGTSVAGCIAGPRIALEENLDVKKYSFHSFGAQFTEVWVDEELETIRVKRFTSVQDCGRIMNEKTARSQIMGGIIFGIGAALMEETVYDDRWANPVTRTLADYHVPVNLDVPPIDVHFIGKPDPHISVMGARGVGEIGIVGVSAAIANAVFNATGKRLRNLPLTLDKLIG